MVVGRIEGAGKMSMKYIYYILEAWNFMFARFIFTYKAL